MKNKLMIILFSILCMFLLTSVSADNGVFANVNHNQNDIYNLTNLNASDGNFTGNVTADFYRGNGSLLTDISQAESDPRFTGNLTGGFEGNIDPDTDSSRSFGATALRWLTGWFDSLVTTTLNTTNINTVGINSTIWTNVSITGSQVSDDGTYLLTTGDIATGNYTFDSGTFFIDSNNNRVGINTTNPLNELEVNGTLNATAIFMGTNNVSTIAYVDIQNTSINNFVNDVTILADGSNALTANWGQGAFNLTTATSWFNGLVDWTSINGLNLTMTQLSWSQLGNGTMAVSSRILTAGSGLTGGGDLSADRTFNVGAGDGITVNADDVAVSFGTSFLGWDNLTAYPVACPSGTFLTQLDDSITCTAPVADDVDPGDFPAGNYSFDTSLLFIDANNNRVGIGTTSPSSSAGFQARLNIEGASTPAIIIKDTDTAQEVAMSATGAGLRFDVTGHATASNNVIIFRTGNINSNFNTDERMRIDSVGNVGIGTVSPDFKLEVQGGGDGNPSLKLGTGTDSGSDGGGTTIIRFTTPNNANWENARYDAFQHIFFSNGVGRVWINSSGNVGIGTDSPIRPLEISNDGSTTQLRITATDNTQFLDLEFTPPGALNSSNLQWAIGRGFNVNRFEISSWDGSSDVERLVIDNVGNVGINITNPNNMLSVFQSATGFPVLIQNEGNNNDRDVLNLQGGADTNTAHTWVNLLDGDGTQIGEIVGDGDNTLSYSSASDERMKENIVDAKDGLGIINKLQPRYFNMITRPEKMKFGLIAQETQIVFPEAVHKPENENGTWMMDNSKIVPVLISAIQEMSVEINLLKEDLCSLGIERWC